jgi:hypothetical protein
LSILHQNIRYEFFGFASTFQTTSVSIFTIFDRYVSRYFFCGEKTDEINKVKQAEGGGGGGWALKLLKNRL